MLRVEMAGGGGGHDTGEEGSDPSGGGDDGVADGSDVCGRGGSGGGCSDGCGDRDRG